MVIYIYDTGDYSFYIDTTNMILKRLKKNDIYGETEETILMTVDEVNDIRYYADINDYKGLIEYVCDKYVPIDNNI